MELDRAADLAVLGGDDGCKLSHTDLSQFAYAAMGGGATISGFGGG
jgi:hypothetical protein